MISDELDKVQRKLHDDGAIWPRSELLKWFTDGYRQFLALSKATRRFWNLNVPGGFTLTHSQEWESAYINGTHNKFTVSMQASNIAGTFLWEAEFIEGIIPTESRENVTQPWERVHSGDWDGYFRFALPRDHEQFRRVAWKERRLDPVTTKELDNIETGWNRNSGLPLVYTSGLGRVKTFEIFAIRTDLIQGYLLKDYEKGIPRRFTGSRTYSAAGLIENAYAYTSNGDAQAINGISMALDPTDSYSGPPDLPHASGLRPWQFTLTGLPSGSQYTTQSDMTASHPWMIDAVQTSEDTYGTHPFEWAFGARTSIVPDTKPDLPGLGWRFTKAASTESNGYGVHIWEKEMLDGETEFTESETIGTYTWEEAFGAGNSQIFPVGTVRQVSSPDRQYMPIYLGSMTQRLLGTIRNWQSSTDAVSILQTILPDTELTEDDLPDLIPSRMLKYLRNYTWSRAFGRQGEGHSSILAAHFERRFKQGAFRFNKLAALTHRDVVYQREPTGTGKRGVPRPKLPPEYPAVDY